MANLPQPVKSGLKTTEFIGLMVLYLLAAVSLYALTSFLPSLVRLGVAGLPPWLAAIAGTAITSALGAVTAFLLNTAKNAWAHYATLRTQLKLGQTSFDAALEAAAPGTFSEPGQSGQPAPQAVASGDQAAQILSK